MAKARDIMTKEVKYIQEDAYINEVIKKMKLGDSLQFKL
jgi:CBS domain-containing protein